MDSLLTDGEKIKLIVEWVKSGSEDVADLVDSTAKAQDKQTRRKLVEWVEVESAKSWGIPLETWLAIEKPPYWQALKEEVGL